MGESRTHIKLVEELRNYVANTYFMGERGAVLCDLPESILGEKPPLIGNFRPDVYATDSMTERIIIGEAKTEFDLERDHSKKQLAAFIKECSTYRKGILVVAVPWDLVVTARQLLKRLEQGGRCNSTTTVVLERLFV